MRKSDMVRKGEDFRKRTPLPTVVPSAGHSGLLLGGSTIPLSPTTLTHEANGSTNNTHQLTTPNLPNGIMAKKGARSFLSDEDTCTHCGLICNATSSRKLIESCGHLMCRSCVVMSEEGCIQCLKDQEENSGTSSSPPPVHNTVLINTQHQNGPLVGMAGPTRTSRASRLSGALEGLQQYHHATIDFKTKVEPASPTGDPSYTTGLSNFPSVSTNSKSYAPTAHFTTGHQNSEPRRNVRKLVVLPQEQIGAEVLTPADTPDSIVVKEETEKGDSDNLSPEQFQDVQKEEEDDAEDDDARVVTKKKKRNPVKIHDHITVLGGDPRMYQCNVCQKKFKTKAHVKYHEFCKKGDKPFECEKCGQGFISKSHYEYHLRVHSGERPFVCPQCGKGFAQRGKVTRHMQSHTGEKPLICRECNRGFACAQALRSHTLIHTGERPFACTYCSKRFRGLSNLKKHVNTHTGERPFSCNHCDKSFAAKWTLDIHLQSHSSDRPFVCDHCGRTFSSSRYLRRHLAVHSDERPFRCCVCDKSFRRKHNLVHHVNSTHNQSKKLPDKAAADYPKLNLKNQTVGNILVSKVNSVITSNITNNADLIPAGGIVLHNLKSKPSQGHPEQLSPKQFQDMQKKEKNDAEGNDGPVAKKKKKSSRAIHDHVLGGDPPTLRFGEPATAATIRRPMPRAASAEPKAILARQSFPCLTCGLSFGRKDALDIHIENTHNQPEEVAKNLVHEDDKSDGNNDTVDCILSRDVDVDVLDDQIILSETGKAGEIYTILDIDQLELDEREISSIQQSSPFTGKLLMSPCPSPSQKTDETKTQATLRLVCTTPPLVVTGIKPEALPIRYNQHVDNEVKIVPAITPKSPGEKLLITDSLEPNTPDTSLPDQDQVTLPSPLTLDLSQNDVSSPLPTDNISRVRIAPMLSFFLVVDPTIA